MKYFNVHRRYYYVVTDEVYVSSKGEGMAPGIPDSMAPGLIKFELPLVTSHVTNLTFPSRPIAPRKANIAPRQYGVWDKSNFNLLLFKNITLPTLL